MSRVVVLGGSSGIGLATVGELERAGHDVVTVARRGGDGPEDMRVDLRDFDQLADALGTLEQHDHIDRLVNCVGVGFFAPLGADNSTAWAQILDTNLRGLLNLASIVERDLPRLEHLVHLSSLAAHRVSSTPGNLAYSVSKAGARTVVQELRAELRRQGRRTRVSMVSPGFVADTDFGAHFFDHRPRPADVPDIYGGHANLQPADVAAAVAYVLDLPAHIEVLDLVLSPTEQPS